jgi:hypothetical protein
MKRALLGIVLLVASCGGGDGSTGGLTPAENALQGNWIADISSVEGLGLTFNDLNYVYSDIAILTDGSVAAQIETGTYTATGGTLTIVPQKWSCPPPDPAATYTYTVSPGSLVVQTSGAILSFVPNTAPPGSGAILTGCFAMDGTFVQRPVQPL